MNKREMAERFGDSVERYKKNLHVKGDKVYSYTTHVATLDHASKKLYEHGKWSPTTSKHVNFIANKYGYPKVDKSADKPTIESKGIKNK